MFRANQDARSSELAPLLVQDLAPERQLTKLADRTEGFSGSDLYELAAEAASLPLHEFSEAAIRRGATLHAPNHACSACPHTTASLSIRMACQAIQQPSGLCSLLYLGVCFAVLASLS